MSHCAVVQRRPFHHQLPGTVRQFAAEATPGNPEDGNPEDGNPEDGNPEDWQS
jgi:hypothetical protein